MKKAVFIGVIAIVVLILAFFGYKYYLTNNELTKEDSTIGWIKCVGKCDTKIDENLGEVINRDCINVCSSENELSLKYEGLDSAILFLSSEVKTCKSALNVSEEEACLKLIPEKYLIN